MTLIKGTSLHGFPELVTEYGADPVPLLASVHLDIAVTDDADRFIDYRSVITALEVAAARTGHPDFGRQLARRQGIEILGPVGIAARTAQTVADALSAVQHYIAVYSPALTITIDPEAEHRYARFEWRINTDHPPPHPQAAELGIGVAIQIFTMLAGSDFRPVLISFRHPPKTAIKDYTDHFGCPVHCNSDYAGFLFPRSILRRPLSADGDVHRVVRDYLDGLMSASPSDVLAQVRLLLRRTLPTGTASLEQTATELATTPRTLQRQLLTTGQTFAEILDELRREEAEHYLTDTNLPLSAVARALGYSEQSVLTRSCKRWYGVPPTTLRQGFQESANVARF